MFRPPARGQACPHSRHGEPAHSRRRPLRATRISKERSRKPVRRREGRQVLPQRLQREIQGELPFLTSGRTRDGSFGETQAEPSRGGWQQSGRLSAWTALAQRAPSALRPGGRDLGPQQTAAARTARIWKVAGRNDRRRGDCPGSTHRAVRDVPTGPSAPQCPEGRSHSVRPSAPALARVTGHTVVSGP